jgi:FMN phosphatase YigB (HAD superfamily)
LEQLLGVLIFTPNAQIVNFTYKNENGPTSIMILRPNISVIVTDLDNTLWDWFNIWHSSFKPFLEELSRVTGISEADLKLEIKAIHQQHHTSEYSHLLQELPCLRERFGNAFNPYEVLPTVVEAFRGGRRAAGKLYPSVLDTLLKIKSAGTIIVGFTESQFYYTTQRVRTFGLDGVLDILYSAEDRGLISQEELQQMRTKPDSFYKLNKTKTRILPTHAKKPNAALLTSILNDLNVTPECAVYIGDDLHKDILMANEAHMLSAHAKYGVSHRDSRYQLLVDVTHWTPLAVELQRNAKKDGTPDYVLVESFSELLNYFNFIPFDSAIKSNQLESHYIDQKIELWKVTVETQQHFNTLQLQIRNYVITLFLAILTAIGYTVKEHMFVSIFGFTTSIATLACIAGLFIVLAFYYMDWGYHQLLIGSVAHGRELENSIKKNITEAGLAAAIKNSSSGNKFLGIFKTNSTTRLHTFYWLLFFALVGAGILGCFAGKPETASQSEKAPLTGTTVNIWNVKLH